MRPFNFTNYIHIEPRITILHIVLNECDYPIRRKVSKMEDSLNFLNVLVNALVVGVCDYLYKE